MHTQKLKELFILLPSDSLIESHSVDQHRCEVHLFFFQLHFKNNIWSYWNPSYHSRRWKKRQRCQSDCVQPCVKFRSHDH